MNYSLKNKKGKWIKFKKNETWEKQKFSYIVTGG